MKKVKLFYFLFWGTGFTFCFANAIGFILFFEKTTENLLQGIGLALLSLLCYAWMRDNLK